jgi:hypothetical protein
MSRLVLHLIRFSYFVIAHNDVCDVLSCIIGVISMWFKNKLIFFVNFLNNSINILRVLF